MSATILDGKAVAAKLRASLAERVQALKARGVTPGLAVVLVGENPASKVYVRNKKSACAKAGLYSEQHDLPETASMRELLEVVESLNQNPNIHGILVQFPLPSGFDERAVIAAISPKKDVDAFHRETVGAVMLGEEGFLPCTPAGIMRLLREYGISVDGKECVVVGRSNIVGKPMAMLLLRENGTVTVCHSKTKNLGEVTRRADILICATGRPNTITADMVKPGAVVVDVGMNRDENGKLRGDVDFDAVSEIASYITPVPGGVGPMTIAMLLENTVLAAE